jgi:hypothetical protein
VRLTEDEKREMREMAESASLQEEFRTMRRNSRAIEEQFTVDQLIRWLTTMARTYPTPAKPRAFVQYTNVKL